MKVRMYKKLVISVIELMVCSISKGQQNKNTPPWKSLFNGKDLTGWKILNDKGNVYIEDGAIVGHPVANTTASTFICTKGNYGDFIFEAEARLEGKWHTGFIVRGSVKENEDSIFSVSGYQVKIDPTDRKWTGGIFDLRGNGVEWYYPLTESEEARSAFKFNEWNRFRIEAIGDSIKIWVNGIPTCNLVHNRYSEGSITIKVHSMGDTPELETAFMKFRDLRIITKNPDKYKMPINYPVINLKKSDY